MVQQVEYEKFDMRKASLQTIIDKDSLVYDRQKLLNDSLISNRRMLNIQHNLKQNSLSMSPSRNYSKRRRKEQKAKDLKIRELQESIGSRKSVFGRYDTNYQT